SRYRPRPQPGEKRVRQSYGEPCCRARYLPLGEPGATRMQAPATTGQLVHDREPAAGLALLLLFLLRGRDGKAGRSGAVIEDRYDELTALLGLSDVQPPLRPTRARPAPAAVNQRVRGQLPYAQAHLEDTVIVQTERDHD